jgi:pimeloyl-ACP methyl ester carboxylesterase
MATRPLIGKRLFRLLVPLLLILIVAFLIALAAMVYGITRPPRHAYLVTPEQFSTISGTAEPLKVTDETWRNRDGSTARGWLLRGAEGAPAVIFLHRYGSDRSYLLNLGMKLNEVTSFTILWPDLRGHGVNPPVKWTSFGGREGDDVRAALDFLRTLKSDGRRQLIGDRVGLYGVELGAYAALRAAGSDDAIQVLVLDSVPRDQSDIVEAVLRSQFRINAGVLVVPARLATQAYFLGQYPDKKSCELARALGTRRVLLLGGEDDGGLRESTSSLARCFPTPSNVETRTDLPISGFTLPAGTGEQGESYDRPIIDFFTKNLR